MIYIKSMMPRSRIKADGPFPLHLSTCPNTSMKVQHWLDDDEDSEETEYEAMTCPACINVHLFNRKTGKLFGEEE